MTHSLLLKRIFPSLLIVLFFGFFGKAQAQVAPYRLTDREVKELLDRIENDAEKFRHSLKESLDKSRLDETRAEDRINTFVKDFERAADRLRDRFNAKNSAAADAEEVLRRGATIDDFMARHALNGAAQNDWRFLRTNLEELARAYNVSWTWPAPGQTMYPRADMPADLLARIRRDEQRLRNSIGDAIVSTSLDSPAAEDIRLNIRDLELATDRFGDRVGDRLAAGDAAGEMLRKAALIESFLRRNALTPGVQEDWRLLRSDLDELSQLYNMSMDWGRGTLTITRVR